MMNGQIQKTIIPYELIKIIYEYDEGNINYCKLTDNISYVLGNTDIMYFTIWINKCDNIDEDVLSMFLIWYRKHTSKKNMKKTYDLLSTDLSRNMNLSVPFIIDNIKYLVPEMFNCNSKILNNIINVDLTKQNAFDVFKLILIMYIDLNKYCSNYQNILESQFKRMYSNNVVQRPHNFVKISNITKKRKLVLKKYKSAIELMDVKIITDKKYKQFIPWTHLINADIFPKKIILQHFEENFTPESTLYDINSGSTKCPKILDILKPKTIITSVTPTMVIDTKNKYQLLYGLGIDKVYMLLPSFERYMTIRRVRSLLF